VSLTAILLLLLAAGFHAGWNLLGKQRRPSPSTFLLAHTAGMLLLAAVVLPLYGGLLRQIPAAVWWALAATGAFQALYYGALAGAYAAGDLSIAYPLARSAPVLLITGISILLGGGHQIGWGCVVGAVLIVAGCFLLPMRHFGDLRAGHYRNACVLLAALAAVGTTGYTLLDDAALRCLRALPERGFGVLSAPLVYLFAEAASSSLWLGAYVAGRPADRTRLARALAEGKAAAATMGLGIFLAYGLVLVSYAYVRNVSYAAAFRQVSILIGVAIAAVRMREPVSPPRWLGAALAFAGLVLVALG